MSDENVVCVAVAGAGAFGRNHLRVLREAGALSGVFDTDPARTQAAAAEFSCKAYASIEALAADSNAAIVAAPTVAHTSLGLELMERGLDVLVEKPIAASIAEAERLVETASRRGRILQVGHLERFNPAVQVLESMKLLPLFFEIHRLSIFTPRSLDVDVVLDLMVHDLEIVLALTGTMPEEIRAAGIQILSKRVDIANVRLQFPGGCVANLTASRASTEQVRKLRLFAPHRYVSLDYRRQDLTSVSVDENQQIRFQPLAVAKEEPLKLEIAEFLDCIRTRRRPRVSGREATQALRVALDILDKIKVHSEVVAKTIAAR
jgi:predicted dehydrogenase